ncbi:MAG: NADH-quinone oxidoreductase subunit C, partial [Burkholderiaceae bacterium]
MSSPSLEALKTRLEALFEGRLRALVVDRGEISITIASTDVLAVAGVLRDDAELRFDTLVDLCGVDYMNFGNA